MENYVGRIVYAERAFQGTKSGNEPYSGYSYLCLRQDKEKLTIVRATGTSDATAYKYAHLSGDRKFDITVSDKAIHGGSFVADMAQRLVEFAGDPDNVKGRRHSSTMYHHALGIAKEIRGILANKKSKYELCDAVKVMGSLVGYMILVEPTFSRRLYGEVAAGEYVVLRQTPSSVEVVPTGPVGYGTHEVKLVMLAGKRSYRIIKGELNVAFLESLITDMEDFGNTAINSRRWVAGVYKRVLDHSRRLRVIADNLATECNDGVRSLSAAMSKVATLVPVGTRKFIITVEVVE